MKGRPPKPIEQRRANKVDHRPLPQVVRIGADLDALPDAPAHLDSFARECWERVAWALHEAGILDRVDLPALEAACTAYGRYRRCAAIVDEPIPDDELDGERKRLDEHRSFVDAVRVLTANKLRAGVDVKPSEVAQLGKAEATLANLEAYVAARAKWGRLVALGSTGQVVASPFLDEERSSANLFLRFCEQYGVTPSARARLGLAVLEGRTLQNDLERDLGPSARRR